MADDGAGMAVTILYGSERHSVAVPAGATVAALCCLVESALGVPVHMQKLIHKGKSVQAGGETDGQLLKQVWPSLKPGAKVKLLGRKLDPAKEALVAALAEEDTRTRKVGAQLEELVAQFDLIQKGFAEQVAKASFVDMTKKLAGYSELLESGLERLDGLEVGPNDRELRKASVLQIQKVLDRVDSLEELIESTVAGEDISDAQMGAPPDID